jgi:hypothetical protein
MSKEIDVIFETKKRLETISSLKYVGEDTGQLDAYSPNFPVKWPLAVVDLGNMTFSNKGHARGQVQEHPQMGNITMTVRVANLRTGNTNAKAPTAQQSQANSIWNAVGDVHAKLHGWSPTDVCSPLIRQSISRARRDDGVQEYVMVYTATLNDI